MPQVALFASFEYLCYGSTAIINKKKTFIAGTVFRHQNLTSIDPECVEGLKPKQLI